MYFANVYPTILIQIKI